MISWPWFRISWHMLSIIPNLFVKIVKSIYMTFTYLTNSTFEFFSEKSAACSWFGCNVWTLGAKTNSDLALVFWTACVSGHSPLLMMPKIILTGADLLFKELKISSILCKNIFHYTESVLPDLIIISVVVIFWSWPRSLFTLCPYLAISLNMFC